MRELDCSQLGFIISIIRSEVKGRVSTLETEWTVLPGRGILPLHRLPFIRQFIKIKSGFINLYYKNEWKTFTAGDELEIDKNVPFTFNNKTSYPVTFSSCYEPAMDMENYFNGLHKFANSGLIKNQNLTFKSVFGLSSLWSNYPVEIKSVNPPTWLIHVLAFFGKMMGYNFR